jgi:hypothetical protein
MQISRREILRLLCGLSGTVSGLWKSSDSWVQAAMTNNIVDEIEKQFRHHLHNPLAPHSMPVSIRGELGGSELWLSKNVRQKLPNFAEAYDFWAIASHNDGHTDVFPYMISLSDDYAYAVWSHVCGTDADAGTMELFNKDDKPLGGCFWPGTEWQDPSTIRIRRFPGFAQTLKMKKSVDSGQKKFSGEKQSLSLLARMSLANVDFSGSDFKSTKFFDCDLTNAKFVNCDLKNAEFLYCKLKETSFEGSDLAGISIAKNNTFIETVRR